MTTEIETPATDAGVSPQAEAPVDAGQVEDGATPEVSYFDLSAHADQRVKLPDGTETTLGDLPNGYLRQSDYTRKTQELAEIRTLQQALQNNPREAIALLQRKFGVDPQVGIEDQTDGGDIDGWDVNDPVVRRLAEYEQRFAPVEQMFAAQQLDQTMKGLAAQYGDLFNPQQVAQRAVELGVTDVSQLDTVARLVMFDNYQAGRAAAAQQQAADEAKRESERATLAATVADGGGVAAGSVAPSKPTINSIEDAFAAAKKQLGYA